MEQSSLFGEAAPPPRLRRPAAPRAGRYRLFFALFPNEAAAQEMYELGAAVKGQFGLAGKLHTQSRLHLTLDHLGDFESMPHDIVNAASAAATAIQASSGGFPVQLDQRLSFGRQAGSRPVVLAESRPSNLALRQFRASLWDALASRDIPGGPRSSFTPHVTLLWDAQVIPEQPVQAIAWPADEFVLLHSAMQETRYEVLGRWRL